MLSWFLTLNCQLCKKRTRHLCLVGTRKKDLASAKSFCVYPEPGSNRHGLLHWCLRPARLPIPPSGPLVARVSLLEGGRPSG